MEGHMDRLPLNLKLTTDSFLQPFTLNSSNLARYTCEQNQTWGKITNSCNARIITKLYTELQNREKLEQETKTSSRQFIKNCF